MRNTVAGFVAGALMFMLIPAQAHHRDSDVARKIRNLQSVVFKHTNSIAALRNQAQYLDSDGFYNAPISQFQVLSLGCAEGDDAVWVQDANFAEVRFVGCTQGPYPKAEQRAFGLDEFLRR